MSPKRIQLRRTKGWRKPEGAIVVARPSRWGNPFTVAGYREHMDHRATDAEARQACVDAFRDWLRGDTWAAGSGREWEQRRLDYLDSIPDLTGRDLACWCPLELAANDGRCLICDDADAVAIDHCHTTGRVRVGLCTSCNTFLGRVEVNPKILSRMASYAGLDQPCHADVLLEIANQEGDADG